MTDAATPRRPLEALESRVLFAAGDIDLTFGGGDGATLVNFAAATSDRGTTLAVLPDGKMIVGGSVGDASQVNDDFGLARLNADGSLDLTFGGGDGLATIDFGAGDAELESIAIAPDGKIVAVGKTDTATTGVDWAVARFNPDGSPDGTFGGGDGMVTHDFFGFSDNAYGVDVQPDGKVVVTGVQQASNTDIAVIRYNVNGTLDNTFDGDGVAVVNFFGSLDFGSAVKVQADNKLIVVGTSLRPGANRQFVLIRLNPNGSPDSTFGVDGLATADFGAQAFARDVEVLPGGKYVVGGWVDSNPAGNDQLDLAVARFNANGTLDTAFGTNGRTVFTGTGGEFFGSYGLEVQQDGKILVGGTTVGAGGLTYAGVARTTANGAPDTTFGPGGVRQYTVPGTTAGQTKARDIELQSDGRILVAGLAPGAAGNVDFAVIRLQNDDGPPPVPGSIAGVVYNDANANGVRDLGETGLSGWTVYQDLNNNGVFDAGSATVHSTDVPKTISAVGTPTVISQLDVPVIGSGSITDVNVTLNIGHSYDADLLITLISPGGQEVQLITRRGEDGDGFINTVLDDEAANPISAGTAPFTASFRPEGELADLDGTTPNGTWRLRIVDEFNGDGGTLNAWSLTFTTGAEPNATTAADGTYRFSSLEPGSYTLREVVNSGYTQTAPAGSSHLVTVGSGQAVTGIDFGNVSGAIPSNVVARSVFYNNSVFDGYTAAASALDDNAIATNKTALLPNGTGTSANVTSYSKGINGVMIDMTRLLNNLEADDFEFRVGNAADPSAWAAAPAPLSVTERPSGRPDGATRVTLVWADGAIRNQWLQVRVKANTDTGLTAPDVFYFGNLVGESSRAAGAGTSKIDASDVMAVRTARTVRNNTVPATDPLDHNKDGRVNVLDEYIVRNNMGATIARLTAPAAAFGEVAIQAARRTRGVPVTRSVLA